MVGMGHERPTTSCLSPLITIHESMTTGTRMQMEAFVTVQVLIPSHLRFVLVTHQVFVMSTTPLQSLSCSWHWRLVHAPYNASKTYQLIYLFLAMSKFAFTCIFLSWELSRGGSGYISDCFSLLHVRIG